MSFVDSKTAMFTMSVDTHGLTPVALGQSPMSVEFDLYRLFPDIQRIFWWQLRLYQLWRKKILVTKTRSGNRTFLSMQRFSESPCWYWPWSYRWSRKLNTAAVWWLPDGYDLSGYYTDQFLCPDDTIEYQTNVFLETLLTGLQVSFFCTLGSIQHDIYGDMHHGHLIWFPCPLHIIFWVTFILIHCRWRFHPRAYARGLQLFFDKNI